MEETRRLRNIWKLMKRRCYNPKHNKYECYGGKGIGVCKKWMKSFEEFANWALLNGYKDDLTLDRKNNDRNYMPSNCRWTTKKEQANNRSNNHMLTFKGKTQSIQKWADETGLSASAITQRLKMGWDVARALTEPNHGTNHASYITYNGETKRMYEWASELGMSKNTLNNRINQHGWPIEKAIETPVFKRGQKEEPND